MRRGDLVGAQMRGAQDQMKKQAASRLRREILAALLFKALALALLYVAFFSSSHRTAISPHAMAVFLFQSH